MRIEEAIKEIEYAKSFGTSGVVPRWEAIETLLSYVETMHKEFDRLEGIEDNTSMLLKELVETKEHNRQLGLEIARLNNRCKKLDREAQSYLEEMVGDEGLKERTIKGLEFEIEQKDKIIDLLADDLRYYEGMGQNDLFCFDTCNHCEYCDKELCKERIKEFYMKKRVKKMMPLEDSIKDMKLYYKRKLKWYEKLWYFLTGKKEEYQELGPIKSLGDDK